MATIRYTPGRNRKPAAPIVHVGGTVTPEIAAARKAAKAAKTAKTLAEIEHLNEEIGIAAEGAASNGDYVYLQALREIAARMNWK